MPSGTRLVGALGRAIAAELRSELARQQMKAVDLARLSGIPQSTVRKILAGARPADADHLGLLSGILGIQASELIARAERTSLGRRSPFGDYIRREREARNLNHAQLGRKVGAGADIVREWEDGEPVPPAARDKLLELFGDVADAR